MNVNLKELMIIVSKKDMMYIYRLYRNYELCNSICKGKINDRKNLLDDYEERLYQEKGKNMSDEIRIFYEFEKITNKCVFTNEIDLLRDIVSSMNFFKNTLSKWNELDDQTKKDYIFQAKKDIAYFQAKLDMPITFFYAAVIKFIEEYSVVYTNYNLKLDSEENSEDIKIYKDNIKYKKNNKYFGDKKR